jgi:Xaa-Pro aminopeptidase
MKRIHKFLEKLKENQLDGFLVSSEANVTYLSGFTGDSSLLFVSANRCMLLTDGRYTEQARIECPPEIEVFKWKDNKRYGIETYQYIAVECHLRNWDLRAV